MLNRRTIVISETTVRPKAALWHPCHRGIRESIHIRLGGPASTDGLEQHPCLTASSPPMALVHKLRNPRFLFTMSVSEYHGSPSNTAFNNYRQVITYKKAINHIGLSLFIILRLLPIYHVNHAT